MGGTADAVTLDEIVTRNVMDVEAVRVFCRVHVAVSSFDAVDGSDGDNDARLVAVTVLVLRCLKPGTARRAARPRKPAPTANAVDWKAPIAAPVGVKSRATQNRDALRDIVTEAASKERIPGCAARSMQARHAHFCGEFGVAGGTVELVLLGAVKGLVLTIEPFVPDPRALVGGDGAGELDGEKRVAPPQSTVASHSPQGTCVPGAESMTVARSLIVPDGRETVEHLDSVRATWPSHASAVDPESFMVTPLQMTADPNVAGAETVGLS